MLTWREARTSHNAAQLLLQEYFRERALTFPAEQGQYRTVFPHEEQFVPPAGVFLIASLAGEDIGCGGIRMLEGTASATVRFEIKHVYLRPAARGHGYGRALLAELEARARAFGAGQVVLDTNLSQVAAAHLYSVTGYHEIAPYNSNANATTWFAKSL
jgi:GNAT superfamily N-acetyltransferase